MGLLDKIKEVFSGDNEFEKVVSDTYKEYLEKHKYFWSPEVNTTSVWKDNVKNWPDKKKVSFILWAIPVIHSAMKGIRSLASNDQVIKKNFTRSAYVQTILRSKLIMDDEDAVNILTAFLNYRVNDWGNTNHWPVNLLINQIEKQFKDQPVSTNLRNALTQMKEALGKVEDYSSRKERIKMMDKIDGILFTGSSESSSIKPAKFLGEDEFAKHVNPAIEQLPQNEKEFWYQLLPLAQGATGSKPTKKYLDDTKALIKEFGTDKFKKIMHEWLQFLLDLKVKTETRIHEYGNGQSYSYNTYEYLSSVNAEALKGLVWTCSQFHDNTTIQLVAALADKTFKKIPGVGSICTSLGNGCLYALYKSKGLDGIGQLSRLRLRIKKPSTQALIDKYLKAAAEEQGVSISEVEDMAVDDCGLTNGSRSFIFDDYKAKLVILGVGKTEIKWYKPDGSLQKSVPAFVKEKHADKLKKLKDTDKQTQQTTTAQRDRIDRMFRDDRKIPMENFRQYYLEHGIMCYLANSIIWNFQLPDKIVSAIHLNNHWVNTNNEIVDITNATTVSLWHPILATVDETKTWRDFLAFHKLQQPLKQAYREVYFLTDAEVNTRVYSNRMAAHILKQYQFNSLTQARGWRYTLLGAFDNGADNKAKLSLPGHNLQAEYWVSEVNTDHAISELGIWNYISTDQVRFVNTSTGQTVDLPFVPPLVFSEVMRDVDLFVGVASVGNDPTWQDTGGVPNYNGYWTSFSFGDLSEIAKNRKEILTNLVPRLKIKDVATIKDKFLVVKGKLRTYKIHIGSTNILMEPNDQYLCIVPDRGQKNHTENVFLPFEGDTGLSIILSKAFLLADDDKIKDGTITSQIKRK